tara:strand:+ start:361 stop:627 length:267 start_codon:yes stop_codon:yes gene_type:complete
MRKMIRTLQNDLVNSGIKLEVAEIRIKEAISDLQVEEELTYNQSLELIKLSSKLTKAKSKNMTWFIVGYGTGAVITLITILGSLGASK